MKYFLRFFILGVLFLGKVCFAQNLEIETVRSNHTPGFFMIKIFPNKETPELKIKNVFVKNFSKEEESVYAPLYEIIEAQNGKIVEDRKIVLQPTERLIFLGETYKNYLSFTPENPQNIKKEFTLFTKTFLEPVFLENVTVEFSKSISDVYPKKVDFLTKNGAIFIGKFDKASSTQIKINGFTENKKVTAMGRIDLSNATLEKIDKDTRDMLTAELPQWWDDFWKKDTFGNTPPPKEFLLKIQSMFPLLLVFAGVLLILFSLKQSFSSKKNEITNEVPIRSFGSFDEDLPFEIVDKHK